MWPSALMDKVGSVSNLPAIEYLFDEEATPMPDLGGIEATLGKRHAPQARP